MFPLFDWLFGWLFMIYLIRCLHHLYKVFAAVFIIIIAIDFDANGIVTRIIDSICFFTGIIDIVQSWIGGFW